MNADIHYLSPENKARLFEYLSGFLTENRKNLFLRVVQNRTKYITVVLEDIFQPHNASAVLRTCECMGIQDVHIIENRYQYNVNPDVTLGSDKWLNVKKYSGSEYSTTQLVSGLRNQGYRIVATCLHSDSVEPSAIPLDQKIALLFGTELEGLTQEAIASADYKLKIPIYGFTESYNISVSAAILLSHFTNRLKETTAGFKLTDEERLDLLLHWTATSVKSSGLIIKKFLKSLPG